MLNIATTMKDEKGENKKNFEVYEDFYYSLRNLVCMDEFEPEDWKSYIRGMYDMAETVLTTLEHED